MFVCFSFFFLVELLCCLRFASEMNARGERGSAWLFDGHVICTKLQAVVRHEWEVLCYYIVKKKNE